MASLIRDRSTSTAEMLEIFGDAFLLKAAYSFEAALARALGGEGLLSSSDVAAIVDACDAPDVDIAELADDAAHAGTLAIPLVQRLRDWVVVRSRTAAEKVHHGATSQDVADTVLILQVKHASILIDAALSRIATALARLTQAHVATPMIGRTLLQPAIPITFGLKAANWLLGMDSAWTRFRSERDGAMQLQFGGAAGTLAGFDGKGVAVAQRIADELGLSLPAMPWHARRDRIAGLGAALAIVAGAAGKVARDISLLSQDEIAEAFEPKIAGRGGSSAMRHKRNATGCQVALSAALRCPALAASLMSGMPQEHERGLGGWQAEAPVLAELFALTHGALDAMAVVLEGLEVDPKAMAHNLQATGLGNDTAEAQLLVRRALEHCRKTI
jgi:3-carboxy-cis,cis-muconate cycloisomerase